MVRAWPLDPQNLRDRRAGEPRELPERNEQFPAGEVEPETVTGNIGHFNFGSAVPMLLGFATHDCQ